MTPAQMMTLGAPVPRHATLLGWIDRHPIRGGSSGYGVLRFDRTGIEAAWDGAALVSLPRDWRERVVFEPAGA